MDMKIAFYFIRGNFLCPKSKGGTKLERKSNRHRYVKRQCWQN